jgi:ubiquinone/menaquinone biosynthesis C-methylase UbiE
MKTLSHAEARAFYDRLGSKQDWQKFFEDPATGDLVEALALGSAQSVVEFGCGTGRLAETLLTKHLPPTCRYIAIDASPTMVTLVRKRFLRFDSRAKGLQSAGEMELALDSDCWDRVISTYVLDLLSEADIAQLLEEAHRVLSPGGLLGLVSLTHGATPVSHVFEKIWTRIHSWHPFWVGGCRPIELLDFVAEPEWRIRHQRTITKFGVPSEIVVAEKPAA